MSTYKLLKGFELTPQEESLPCVDIQPNLQLSSCSNAGPQFQQTSLSEPPGLQHPPSSLIVMQQPRGNNSISPPGSPPGLQCLASLDKILVHQKYEIIEMLTGWETENKYAVKNSQGQTMFKSSEKSKWYSRLCLQSLRPFELNIHDNNYQNQVIQLKRNFACQGCLCCCCLQVLRVYAPKDVLIGTVEECWSLRPYFEIKDEFGTIQMIIKRDFCYICACCRDIVYKVFLADGRTRIGDITKVGNCEKCFISIFSDADDFEINFPQDLDIKLKTLLLGACYLIDYMFYEF